uniref:Uncharacterized protein n=1 Tax=Rhizophora mucronata TaxID=61149 RepID=A0A2P2Q3B1_RHIMU
MTLSEKQSGMELQTLLSG